MRKSGGSFVDWKLIVHTRSLKTLFPLQILKALWIQELLKQYSQHDSP